MRRSLSAYARALQVDRKTLRAWTGRADWKWGRSPAMWPASATVAEWRAIHIERTGGALPGASLRSEGGAQTAALAMKLSAGLKRAERDHLNLRRQVLQGELIPRARLDRELLELCSTFRGVLDEGVRRLPALLGGAPSEVAAREAEDWSTSGASRLRGLTRRMIELEELDSLTDRQVNPAKSGAANARHAATRQRRKETRG